MRNARGGSTALALLLCLVVTSCGSDRLGQVEAGSTPRSTGLNHGPSSAPTAPPPRTGPKTWTPGQPVTPAPTGTSSTWPGSVDTPSSQPGHTTATQPDQTTSVQPDQTTSVQRGRTTPIEPGQTTGPGETTGSGQTTSTQPGKARTSPRQVAVAKVKWVPFGPAAADSPPPMEWFGRTHRAVLATGAERVRRCADLAVVEGDTLGRMRSAYRGVGEACLGSLSGDAARWSAAVTYLNQARQDLAGAPQTCLESAVVSLLQRLVAAHRAQPSSRLELVPASGTACPWQIDRLELRDPIENAPELVAGQLEGGTRVKIVGAGLVQVSAVYFGDVKATEFTDGNDFAGQFMYACSPPSAHPGKVRITVTSPGGRRTSPPGAVFEYSAGVPNSPSSECG